MPITLDANAGLDAEEDQLEAQQERARKIEDNREWEVLCWDDAQRFYIHTMNLWYGNHD